MKGTITLRQVGAVALGNALEFYDFLVYAFFAVQIAAAFFPAGSANAGLLAALATFGAGFLTRPIGAVVLGGLGDRIGRKPAMLVSFALIGAASLGVALTPGYASIGWAAPALVIVFRLVQGFALGGEVGASTAFLIEASPVDRRGLYVSLQYAGQNLATMVAGIVGVVLSASLGAEALASWGWRVAFLLGAAIVPVGLVLRRSLPETLEADVLAEPVPRVGSYARVATLALLMLIAGTVSTYVCNYMTTYAVTTLGMPTTLSFGATVVVGICGTLFSPIGGWLADRVGRKPVMIGATLVVMAWVLPAFWAISTWRTGVVLYAATAVLRTAIGLAQAASLVAITESLPRRVRSGSLAVIYAVAISVFGGSTQFVVAWLIGWTGDPLVPAWYLLGATVLGFAAMVMMRESRVVRDPVTNPHDLLLSAINDILRELSTPTSALERSEGWNDDLKARWLAWFVKLQADLEHGRPVPPGWGILRSMNFDGVDPSALATRASRIGRMLDQDKKRDPGSRPG